MLERLISYVHAALDKAPHELVALRIHHANGFKWSIANRTLSAGTEAGASFGVLDLESVTIEGLADWLVTHGCTVGYANPDMAARLASMLLSGSGVQSQSNGDALYAYDSLLWTILDCYAAELEAAQFSVQQAIAQMSLRTASGEWLDYWGSFFGIGRDVGEADNDYLLRLVTEVLRPRNGVDSVESAVLDLSGIGVRLREPWKEIFTLDESAMSGAHHFQDGNFYTWNVVQPILDARISVEEQAKIYAIIDRNRPAGTLIVGEGFAVAPIVINSVIDVVAFGGVFSGYRANLVSSVEGQVLDDSLGLSDDDPQFPVSIGCHILMSGLCLDTFEMTGVSSGVVAYIPGTPPIAFPDISLSGDGYGNVRGDQVDVRFWLDTWETAPGWVALAWGSSSVISVHTAV